MLSQSAVHVAETVAHVVRTTAAITTAVHVVMTEVHVAMTEVQEVLVASALLKTTSRTTSRRCSDLWSSIKKRPSYRHDMKASFFGPDRIYLLHMSIINIVELSKKRGRIKKIHIFA